MDSLMSQVQKSAEDAPRPQKRQRVAAVNMGQDPFQVIAARLHEIRRYMIEHNKKDGNIEIEVKLGYIINKDYDGRTGPFRPGAGAIEILAADMAKRRFVSGTTKKDFETFKSVQEQSGSSVQRSNNKDYKFSDGRRVQVDEAGNQLRERKTRELESQFHLPACPYDLRMTVSIEKEIGAEEAVGEISDDWESCRHKHRTSFVGAALPNRQRSLWQADMTHVEMTMGMAGGGQEGHPGGVEHTYEVELELSGDAVKAWFSAADPEKETSRVAWDLWERVQAMMPREQTCSSLKEITGEREKPRTQSARSPNLISGLPIKLFHHQLARRPPASRPFFKPRFTPRLQVDRLATRLGSLSSRNAHITLTEIIFPCLQTRCIRAWLWKRATCHGERRRGRGLDHSLVRCPLGLGGA